MHDTCQLMLGQVNESEYNSTKQVDVSLHVVTLLQFICKGHQYTDASAFINIVYFIHAQLVVYN